MNGYFVKEIIKLTKGKYEVSLEGGEPLVLYGKELSAYKIKEGCEISFDTYERIIEEVLNKRATLRAMHLLEKMDYTKKALCEKLKKNGYPLKSIDYAIAYVESYHYIDDERFAQNYIHYHQQRESKRVIKQKLMQKGVSTSIIEETMEEFYETDETELAIALLKKRKYDSKTADLKEKQRTYAFLARKGISSSAITKAMKMDSLLMD